MDLVVSEYSPNKQCLFNEIAADFQQIASVVHDIHRYKLFLLSRNDAALLEWKGGWIGGCAANPSPKLKIRTLKPPVTPSLRACPTPGGEVRRSNLFISNFRQSIPPKLHRRHCEPVCRLAGRYDEAICPIRTSDESIH